MPDQLAISVGFPPISVSPGLPQVVVDILYAARAAAFSTRIARGSWGIGIGKKRRWVLTSASCCALSACLVAKEAVAEPHEMSPRATAVRVLGITGDQLDSFVHGFDGHSYVDNESEWYRYGEMVAKEVVQ